MSEDMNRVAAPLPPSPQDVTFSNITNASIKIPFKHHAYFSITIVRLSSLVPSTSALSPLSLSEEGGGRWSSCVNKKNEMREKWRGKDKLSKAEKEKQRGREIEGKAEGNSEGEMCVWERGGVVMTEGWMQGLEWCEPADGRVRTVIWPVPLCLSVAKQQVSGESSTYTHTHTHTTKAIHTGT